MEGGNERLAARSGDRLRAALVLVHDGANSDNQRKHTFLSAAGLDLVFGFERGAKRIFRDRCGMASRGDDATRLSDCWPGRAPAWGKHLSCAGYREFCTG